MAQEVINPKTDKEVDCVLDHIMDHADKNDNDYSVSHDSEDDRLNNIDYFIQTANAKILLNTLAPEVSKNEERKRDHKDKLIKYVSIFLGAQFFVIFLLVLIVVISIIQFHATGNDFPITIIDKLFAFFGTYTASVIIELIYILKYIVVNVFDTSISGLMEVFKSQVKRDK